MNAIGISAASKAAVLSDGASITGMGDAPDSLAVLSTRRPYPAFECNVFRSPYTKLEYVAVEGTMVATIDVPVGEELAAAWLNLTSRGSGYLNIGGDKNNPAQAAAFPLIVERIEDVGSGHSSDTPGVEVGRAPFPVGEKYSTVKLDVSKLQPGPNRLRIRVDLAGMPFQSFAQFVPGGTGGKGFQAAVLDFETQPATEEATGPSAEDEALAFLADFFGITGVDIDRLRAFAAAIAQL